MYWRPPATPADEGLERWQHLLERTACTVEHYADPRHHHPYPEFRRLVGGGLPFDAERG
jgi:hypothetical protein